MNPEPENFESLRRLIKLKRYEQPPPRYFKDFSSQVIARINKEQTTPSLVTSWLDRFSEIFQARPALSGVLGASVCVLLLGTAVYSENGDNNTTDFAGPGLTPHQTIANAGSGLRADSGPMSLVSSTNPVIRVPGSLFDLVPTHSPVLANFR